MNGDVEVEASRPRPLSAGIWTIFSWLRRTERSSSSESISSVGSDRTAASFDFLAPVHYKDLNQPLVLPQSPVTDTYKNRLLERNIRRQNEQDLTLRRKYGLYTEEGLGYDAFSLPPARKISKDSVRLRRATSEGAQRRAAYVPGKRRAPLPPNINISASLPRNYKRKRPAPKPPTNLEENKENIEVNKKIEMDSESVHDKYDTKNISLQCKIDRPVKQDLSKDVKLRSDKSFLKQFFDNKKRNSAIDTTHVKLLPSISELDKQAAEIIETKRSLGPNRIYNNDNILQIPGIEGNWICTICFKKYSATVTSCTYCVITKKQKELEKNASKISATNTCTQTENLRQSDINDVDEKKKLREMLKEMKDSLPKRPKHDKKDSSYILPATETPTLRIGTTMKVDKDVSAGFVSTEMSANKSNDIKLNIQQAKNSFLLSQPCSSKQIVSDIVLSNLGKPKIRNQASSVDNFHNTVKEDVKPIKCDKITNNIKLPTKIGNDNNEPSVILTKNIPNEADNVNKMLNSKETTTSKGYNIPVTKDSNKSSPKTLLKKNFNTNSNENTENIPNPNKTSQRNASRDHKYNESEIQNKSKRQSVLFPIKEVEVSVEKPDKTTKNKIECIRLGDVISSSEVKKNENITTAQNSNIHVPLKVSSLLNPIYSPKNDTSKASQTDRKRIDQQSSQKLNILSSKSTASSETSKNVMNNTKPNVACLNITKKEHETIQPAPKNKEGLLSSPKASTSADESVPTTSTNNLDIHARRRELISQLEQAIAKGDEQVAAEAAAKLAKLKLSCSVLSFSSQIVSEQAILPKTLEIGTNNVSGKENYKQENVSCPKKDITEANLIKAPTKVNKAETNFKECTKSDLASSIPSTSKNMEPDPDEIIPISVWIEDKEAARGPIRLNVPRKAVVGDLKKEAERSLGLEIRLQRWIIGRTLCSNDDTYLTSLAGVDLVAPFYLCLVESETTKNKQSEQVKDVPTPKKEEEKSPNSGEFYTELMKLEQQALVPNTDVFECGVCIEECAIGAGAVLRECIHSFCRECLCDVVRHCEEPVVPCPAIGCPGALQEREIRALLTPDEYEKWLARGLAAAESGTRNTFHCRTRDCTGWAFCEPGVRKFPCPVCKHTNCLPCQAVHEGETCERYQAKLRETVTAAEANQTDEGTQALLKSLIERGEALECPECKAIITKKWGCDWIKCSACKTEICWVTKGRRWGPGGKGDTSGGCRCGVDGKRCHPSCGYCH